MSGPWQCANCEHKSNLHHHLTGRCHGITKHKEEFLPCFCGQFRPVEISMADKIEDNWYVPSMRSDPLTFRFPALD